MPSMQACASWGRLKVTYALPLGPFFVLVTPGGIDRFTDTCRIHNAASVQRC